MLDVNFKIVELKKDSLNYFLWVDKFLEAWNMVFGPQMTKKYKPLSRKELDCVLEQKNIHILILVNMITGTVIGTGTIFEQKILTARFAEIHNLAVDEFFRDLNFDKEIIRCLINLGDARNKDEIVLFLNVKYDKVVCEKI